MRECGSAKLTSDVGPASAQWWTNVYRRWATTALTPVRRLAFPRGGVSEQWGNKNVQGPGKKAAFRRSTSDKNHIYAPVIGCAFALYPSEYFIKNVKASVPATSIKLIYLCPLAVAHNYFTITFIIFTIF